ncbi:MAG: hypothetical protein HY321_14110 [Armatimonadetes bacterium]|nr:hypothetical protein [Armatimonadota bacterium]
MLEVLRSLQFAAVAERAAARRSSAGDVSEPAEALLNAALAVCAQKLEPGGDRDVIGRMREGDGAACGYYRAALAARVAAYLGEREQSVKSAYLFDYDAASDEEGEECATPTSPVRLVVHVSEKTGALGALIQSLDSALTGQHARLVGTPELAHLLEAHVVDDAEAEARTGYGALLSARHRRPLQVWKR